eukprot:96944_1
MAQSSTTSNTLNAEFQNISNKVCQQQTQFASNQQSTAKLQSKLLHTNQATIIQDQNDEESKQPSQLKLPSEVDVVAEHVDFASMHTILCPELLDACDQMNFVYLSKIQLETIPVIPLCLKKRRSLVGQGPHGSGKTVAFAFIMLQRVSETHDKFSVYASISGRAKLQGLVVVYSRELAIQTHSVCQSLGQFISGLKIYLAIPNETYQNDFIIWDSQICIGTPGTIIKIFEDKQRREEGLKGFLSQFKIFIIDGADKFVDVKAQHSANKRGRGRGRRGGKRGSSFGSLLDQVQSILRHLHSYTREMFQILLFSVTVSSTVKKLARAIGSPIIIRVGPKQVQQLDNVKIFKVKCNNQVDKFDTLFHTLQNLNYYVPTIIYVNTVNKAKKLVNRLRGKHLGIFIECSVWYGPSMGPELRDKTMADFRKGYTQCLVVSNVIERGVDIPNAGLVVNFQLPILRKHNELEFDSETFMHRLGRTGRFAAKGVCVNLVANDDPQGNDGLNALQKGYALDIKELDKSGKVIEEAITNWLVNKHDHYSQSFGPHLPK